MSVIKLISLLVGLQKEVMALAGQLHPFAWPFDDSPWLRLEHAPLGARELSKGTCFQPGSLTLLASCADRGNWLPFKGKS